MDFLGFIDERMLILIAVLIAIGRFMKKAPNIQNWVIPFTLLFLGIIGACGIAGLSVNGVFQGVLASFTAVFSYESFKALREGTEKKDG